MSIGTGSADPVAVQAEAVVEVLRSTLPSDAVVAVYLYGSAVAGGLRRDSDLDLLGVVTRRLGETEKRALVAGLVEVSWRRVRPTGWRPVELTLVAHHDIRPWQFPPVRAFQYGEWNREELLAGRELSEPLDPDLAVLLTMVRASGMTLFGPAPETILDPVPAGDLRRAVLETLPRLLLDTETDTRNVLLTLARMLATVETGDIWSKDAAATWASDRLAHEHRPLLGRARSAYLGDVEDRWPDVVEARRLAGAIVELIVERGRHPGGPLPPADASV